MGNILPIILSGGAGTRLWPLSTPEFPKQFHCFFGSKTLFQSTVERASAIEGATKIAVVCNEMHRFLATQQASEVTHLQLQLYLEPEGRNTAPAIACVAHEELRQGRDPWLLVLSADHYLPDIDAFVETVKQAKKLSENTYLVALGIKPSYPETAYGYIHSSKSIKGVSGAYQVDKFIEKPNEAAAKELIKDPKCTWNSGIFLMRASVYISELGQYAPLVYEHSLEAVNRSLVSTDIIQLNAEAFNKCPNISVDYAVFEHSQRVATITYRGEWSDLGSWASVAKMAKTSSHTVYKSNVKLVEFDGMNNYVYSNKKVVILGLSDISVIETDDALLVISNQDAQKLKELKKHLKF